MLRVIGVISEGNGLGVLEVSTHWPSVFWMLDLEAGATAAMLKEN